jgi:hypothetical protein
VIGQCSHRVGGALVKSPASSRLCVTGGWSRSELDVRCGKVVYELK